jgi:hypothetical protein
LSLGITDPFVRVLVWLSGCGSLSLAGALLGPVGLLLAAAVLTVVLLGKLAS